MYAYMVYVRSDRAIRHSYRECSTYRQIALCARICPPASNGSSDDSGDWVVSLGTGKVSGCGFGHSGGGRSDDAAGMAVDDILDALLNSRLHGVPLDLKRRHGLVRSN